MASSLTPPHNQISADSTGVAGQVAPSHVYVAGVLTVTETLTIPKKTFKGTTGSITIVNGKVTAHTDAT